MRSILSLALLLVGVVLSSAPALAGGGGIDGSGTVIPGPAALGLFAAGVGALILVRRLRRRR